MKQFMGFVSKNVAMLALVVTTMNAYLAHSTYTLNQGTQKAAIFSQFQQQYTAIEARFPAEGLCG